MKFRSVVAGDIKKIDMLKSYGANLSAINYDLRTALHIACAEGKEEVVRHLLLNGAAVHIRDRYDRSPLSEAINHDHHEIIKLLLKVTFKTQLKILLFSLNFFYESVEHM